MVPSARAFLALGSFFLLGACRGSGNPAGSGGGDLPPGDLCISEIMYHPVQENSLRDVHEFIEIYNRGDKDIDLGGMKLRGGADYDFEERSLAPGEFIVIAKNREALLSLTHYTLDAALVVGNFDGNLSNDGESIRIEAKNGETIDSVTYDDGFPWPISADGLGVSEDWLGPESLPLSAHQHAGRSLARLSCEKASNNPGVWDASPLDGPSPGQTNPGMDETSLTVVVERSAKTESGATLIGPTDPAHIFVKLSDQEGASGLLLEYFTDQLGVDNEPTSVVELSGIGSERTAILPAQAENSIVRYRVLGDRGAGQEVISPRPSDPYDWHAYFVDPGIQAQTKLYHLFIDPDDWAEMWDNVTAGREDDCDLNERWQDRVPATFIYEGEVFDVQVRYQGSRWNRDLGPELSGYDGAAPQRPNPLRGMSYRIGFPRYHHLNGHRVTILNKLVQGCPGYTAITGFQLFRDAGLIAPSASYARLHINGDYYRYMLEMERVDEDLLTAFHAQSDASDVGHLFKASGLDGDAGPYGWGNGSLLEENCGYSPLERYQYTYPRKTHEWDGHERFITMLEGLHAARAQGTPALRTYLNRTFDVDKMITYYGVMNFLTPFDDSFHNYYYYQRLSDEKWILIPWDMDLTLGGMLDSDASLFIGKQGNRDAFGGWWNVIKDSFLTAYETEYLSRIKFLNLNVTSPTKVKAMLQAAYASANWPEAESAPSGVDCNYQEALRDMQTFVDERSRVIQEWSGGGN